MGKEIDLLVNYPKAKRNVDERDDKETDKKTIKKRDGNEKNKRVERNDKETLTTFFVTLSI